MLRSAIVPEGLIIACAIGIGAAPQSHASGPVYSDCDEANSAGVYNIPKGDPAYWPGGDRDKDGYACDSSNS